MLTNKQLLFLLMLYFILFSGFSLKDLKPKKPKIIDKNITVTSVSSEAVTLKVALTIENENAFPAPISKLKYTLDIYDQKDFAQGTLSVEKTIKAKSRRVVTLIIKPSLKKSLKTIPHIFGKEKIPVTLHGKLYIPVLKTELTISFKISGSIPRNKALKSLDLEKNAKKLIKDVF
ncbi:MAG: LEA type 2 family protein [bacterium]